MSYIKKKLKPEQVHFVHGWAWGIIIFAVVLLLASGIRHGYFSYWFGSDYRIVNVHEVIQTSDEGNKLAEVMRHVSIDHQVLVGAPDQVVYYDGSGGFSGYNANNTAVLDAQKRRPKRYSAFCTFNPTEPGYMQIVADCVSRGASGFKLYTGHSFFHSARLDDPMMFAFYDYMQEQSLPLIFHVNSAKYQDEFEAVLKLYPDMKVICPHFCLTSSNLQRLSYLFDTYPNLHTDISFGDEEFLAEGLERISADPLKYKEFIEKYSDRFFFGTDIIVTDYEGKDVEWLRRLFQVYRDMLEQENFLAYVKAGIEFKGLGLDRDVLTQIYEKNWDLMLAGK
jgi:predicted TIM-barrel fold metal-dependent hydrolase